MNCTGGATAGGLGLGEFRPPATVPAVQQKKTVKNSIYLAEIGRKVKNRQKACTRWMVPLPGAANHLSHRIV